MEKTNLRTHPPISFVPDRPQAMLALQHKILAFALNHQLDSSSKRPAITSFGGHQTKSKRFKMKAHLLTLISKETLKEEIGYYFQNLCYKADACWVGEGKIWRSLDSIHGVETTVSKGP